MPTAPSPGTCSASQANGAISRPNSAMEGIVCTAFSTPSTGPRKRFDPLQQNAERQPDQNSRTERAQSEHQMNPPLRPKIRRAAGKFLEDGNIPPNARAQKQRQHQSAPARRRRAGPTVKSAGATPHRQTGSTRRTTPPTRPSPAPHGNTGCRSRTNARRRNAHGNARG